MPQVKIDPRHRSKWINQLKHGREFGVYLLSHRQFGHKILMQQKAVMAITGR